MNTMQRFADEHKCILLTVPKVCDPIINNFARRLTFHLVLEAMRQYSAAPVKPKVSRAALDSLVTVTNEELEAGKVDNSCIICYNEFNVSNPEGVTEKPLRLPKCGHVFGDVCIKQWFEDKVTCPYCRDKLPVETVDHRSRASEAAAFRAHALLLRQARLGRERNELRNNRNNAASQDLASRYERFASVIDDLYDDLLESPQRATRQSRGPPAQSSLESGRYPRGYFSGSVRQSGSSNTHIMPLGAGIDSTSSSAQQAAPAVAVGSRPVVPFEVPSPNRLSGFSLQGNGSRRYSGEEIDRLVNTRDSLHHGNSTPLSLSPPSSSSPGNNAVFGPSERQLAMGSPRPISQGLPEDYREYQTQAPWAGSSGSEFP